MEFLEVQNLCKTYGKGDNQVTALDHVSLTIAKGEFTAIIGSSRPAERFSSTGRTCTPKTDSSWPFSAGGRWG